MKKVLIIAHLYHASPRIPGIAKNLKKFGWEVTIVTPPIDSADNSFGSPYKDIKSWCTIVETTDYGSIKGSKKSRKFIVKDYLDDKKEGIKFLGYIFTILKSIYRLLKRNYHEIIWFPDSEKQWIPIAIEKCNLLLKNGKYDAVISSSSPVSAHIIANKVSSNYQIPWIADLRDLWSNNHFYPYSRFRRGRDRALEKKTFISVNKIITISDPFVVKLRKLHIDKKVCVIENGFDEDLFNNKVELTKIFTLTYTGQIYHSDQQDPEKVLIAFRQLIDENKVDEKDVALRYYGPSNSIINKYSIKHHMENVVKLYDTISPEIVIKKQKESQLLLLLNCEDRKQEGVYFQKIFDYLGARRPILATGGFHNNDVRDQLIKKTSSGKYCCSIDEIKDAIYYYYQDYKMNGFVQYAGREHEIIKYSHKSLSKQFAIELDSITSIKQ